MGLALSEGKTRLQKREPQESGLLSPLSVRQ